MELLERETELKRLNALRASARRDAGCCAVVAGTAGIGKTSLLQRLARSPATLAAAGGELEDDVPFGIVRELLGPLAEQRQLSDATALCAPVFSIGRVAADPRAAGAILHGLYWLVADAAASAALTLVVDDVQWADPASIRFLTYLARRIADLPCLLVLGLRSGPHARLRPDVRRLVALAGSQQMFELKALSATAVGTLVGNAFGRDVEEPFAQACMTATGGNPLLCVALAAELARAGARGTADEREAVERAGTSGVAAWVRGRIDRCEHGADQIALAVAVLGPAADYRRVRALAAVTEDQAATAVDALVAEDVLEDARPLRFSHPILRAAVLDAAGTVARARQHARAAHLLIADGLEEEAARHLRSAEPLGDHAAVDVLRRAAERALARGASDVAAAYLTRALDEPPSAARRAELLYELGVVEAYAGLAPAAEHLLEARRLTQDERLQVRIAQALGDMQMWAGQWEESVRNLDAGIAATSDPEATALLQAQIVRAATGSARVRRLASDRLQRLRARADFAPGEHLAMGLLAIELAMTRGPAPRVCELATRALADGALLAPDQPEGVHELTATSLALVDAEAEAMSAYEAAVAVARERGNAMLFARVSALRGWSLLRFGRPLEAEADARGALGLIDAAAGNAVLETTAVGTLIGAVLQSGGPVAARAVADQFAHVEADDDSAGMQPLPVARAALALAERRSHIALNELDVARRWERAYSNSAAGFVPWRPVAIGAHLLLGEHDAARFLAAEQLAYAEAFESETELAVALHATALASGDVATLERAVDAFERSPARTLHVAALTDLGAMLRGRREPVAARTPLREAIELATRAGAAALADRARDELMAAGARPRRDQVDGGEALTPAEERAARMAAEGLTNRQIAQATFVSHRTIEMHLSNAYRKLDIEGRGELAAALDGTPSEMQAPVGPQLAPARA
ncbi:MAG TPA: AAA family ATPase [Conexibacter sp.]|jgi:DNA-binding CsgD family transcriptional regulator